MSSETAMRIAMKIGSMGPFKAAENIDREFASLTFERDIFQAELHKLMPLAVAVAACNRDEVPEAVFKAWQEPHQYHADEVVRLREQVERLKTEMNREKRRATIAEREVERLRQRVDAVHGALADAGNIVVDCNRLGDGVRQLIAERNNALTEVERLRARLNGTTFVIEPRTEIDFDRFRVWVEYQIDHSGDDECEYVAGVLPEIIRLAATPSPSRPASFEMGME